MADITRLHEHPLGAFLREKFPGLEISVYARGRALILEDAVVPEALRQKHLRSMGNQVMHVITDFADYAGLSLIVNAHPVEGYSTDQDKLTRAYRRWGFKPRKRVKRLTGENLMVRLPHTKKIRGKVKP